MAIKWMYIDDVKLVIDIIVTVDIGDIATGTRQVFAGRLKSYDEHSFMLDISSKFHSQEINIAYSSINHIWEGDVEDAKQPTTSDNR